MPDNVIRFKLTLFLLGYGIAKEVNQEFKKPFQAFKARAQVVQTVDSAIQPLNNRGQIYKPSTPYTVS